MMVKFSYQVAQAGQTYCKLFKIPKRMSHMLLYILPDHLSSIIGRCTLYTGLQDESLQVTISKLPSGSLTCTGGDSFCTGDIQLKF